MYSAAELPVVEGLLDYLFALAKLDFVDCAFIAAVRRKSPTISIEPISLSSSRKAWTSAAAALAGR